MNAVPRFSPGNLVRARGREWVVLPGTDADRLNLRPLSGSEADAQTLLPDVELDPDCAGDLPGPGRQPHRPAGRGAAHARRLPPRAPPRRRAVPQRRPRRVRAQGLPACPADDGDEAGHREAPDRRRRRHRQDDRGRPDRPRTARSRRDRTRRRPLPAAPRRPVGAATDVQIPDPGGRRHRVVGRAARKGAPPVGQHLPGASVHRRQPRLHQVRRPPRRVRPRLPGVRHRRRGPHLRRGRRPHASALPPPREDIGGRRNGISSS